MRPLPVLATIREAWKFTFTQIGAIMGLIWLPMIIVTVSGFFMQQGLAAETAAAQASNNMALLGPTILGMCLYFLASLLLNAMMIVSVTQLALGQRQGGAMAHFALGPPEWRMFRALLKLVVYLLPLLLLGLMVMGLAPTNTAPAGALGVSAVFLLIYCGVIFMIMRFAFLLPAVVVTSEDAPALVRSWKLSAGNFWRILAVALGAAGPIVVLAAIVQFALEMALAPTGAGMGTIAGSTLPMPPPNLPLSAGLQFLIAPFVIGLGMSAGVFSYKALTRTDIIA